MKQSKRGYDRLEATDNRTKLANELERYNKWRRGAEGIEHPNPTELGMLIDDVVKELRKSPKQVAKREGDDNEEHF